MWKEIVAKITDTLLLRHYGINLNDNYLSDDCYLESLIESGEPVYVAINEIAEDTGINRIDCGFSFNSPLRLADEVAATKTVLGEIFIENDSVTCGKCGSRTDFEEFGSCDDQIHFCLNTSCGNVFVASIDAATCV